MSTDTKKKPVGAKNSTQSMPDEDKVSGSHGSSMDNSNILLRKQALDSVANLLHNTIGVDDMSALTQLIEAKEKTGEDTKYHK